MKLDLSDDHENARIPILEAAIHLCANTGWSNMTIRAVADAAGVNSAMLGYYFKNKDTFAREVIRLTMERLSKNRTNQLEQLHQDYGEIIPVYDLVRAFVAPFLQDAHPLRDEIRAYLSLSSLLYGKPSDPLTSYARAVNREIAMQYIDEIERSCGFPGRERLNRRFEMMLGALVFLRALTDHRDEISFFSRATLEDGELLDSFAQDWSSMFCLQEPET